MLSESYHVYSAHMATCHVVTLPQLTASLCSFFIIPLLSIMIIPSEYWTQISPITSSHLFWTQKALFLPSGLSNLSQELVSYFLVMTQHFLVVVVSVSYWFGLVLCLATTCHQRLLLDHIPTPVQQVSLWFFCSPHTCSAAFNHYSLISIHFSLHLEISKASRLPG